MQCPTPVRTGEGNLIMSAQRIRVHTLWGNHPRFDPTFDQMEFIADSGHLKIWRFIDFWKLADLLATRELHFTRLDQFPDSLEGTKSGLAWERDIRATFDRYMREAFPPTQAGIQAAREGALGVVSVDQDFTRATTFASCWNTNEDFNPALWPIYTKKPSPVAIESTVERLLFAANYQSGGRIVHIRPITYIDHASEDMDEVMKHLFKDKKYQFEHELRAHVYDAGQGESMAALLSRPSFRRSPCDLNRLIAAIHVQEDYGRQDELLRLLRDAGLEMLPVIAHSAEATA